MTPDCQLGDRLLCALRIESAQDEIDLRFLALVAFARLRRADIEDEGEARHLPEQLQEFRLPVLQRIPVSRLICMT